MIHYQFRYDRTRRTLRGIDDQVAKAQCAVDGQAPVKRNRYIQLTGATRSVNRALGTKTRALAGWKGYTTNLVGQPPDFVIDAYRCGASRRPSGCPNMTSQPGRFTTAPVIRLRRIWDEP